MNRKLFKKTNTTCHSREGGNLELDSRLRGNDTVTPKHISGIRKNLQSGQAVIINTLIFLGISTLLSYGVTTPVISSFKSVNAIGNSKDSFLLANSAAEEALYKLKHSMALSASENLTLNGNTATINVGDTSDGKTITINSDVGSYERNIQYSVLQGEGVSFNYGLQVGLGGFEMSGGAGVYGNIYANGDVTGSGGPFVTGSVTVANQSDPTPNQENGSTIPPTYSVDFGGNSTPQDASQSFKVTDSPVTSVRFYIKKSTNNWMNNVTVRIVNDSSGKPGKTTYAQATIYASQITTSYNYLTVPFSSDPGLSSGTTYWIVLDSPTTWGSYYSIGASSNTYTNGVSKTGTWASNNGGTWSNTSPSG